MGAAVVCCGNVLMGDDGVGIAVAGALSSKLPPDLDFFVAETDPFLLADIIERHETVFVVDAVRASGVPDGRVVVRRIGHDPLGLPLDAHSFGLLDALCMLEPSVLECRQFVLLGISVSDVVPRAGLSRHISDAQDSIISEICREIANYLNSNPL